MKDLREAMASMKVVYDFPRYLTWICLEILSGSSGVEEVNRILRRHEVDPSEAKPVFLKFIIEYLWQDLDLRALTREDMENVLYFKKIFSIQPGDFVRHVEEELNPIMLHQAIKTYRSQFGKEETPLSDSDLQEMFDLTEEEMFNYSIGYTVTTGGRQMNIRGRKMLFGLSGYFR